MLISGIMAVFYGMYHIGALGDGEKQCLANNGEFHPHIIKDQKDTDLYLSRPSAEDVSQNFDHVIRCGFYSNCILTAYLLAKLVLIKKEVLESYVVLKIMFDLGTNVMWIVQFIQLVYYRFSNTGGVCSGDFQQFIEIKGADSEFSRDTQYDQFILYSEGRFLKVYSLICLAIVGTIVCLGFTCGTCICLTNSMESYENIEDFFKKMDSVQDIMKKQQEAQQKGYGGAAPKEKPKTDEEAKNDFRNEFFKKD